MSSIDHSNLPAGTARTPQRLVVTPLARKIAQERRLNLAHIRGSGPRGRIIAADVLPAPQPEVRPAESVQTSALGTRFSLIPIETMLEAFSRAELRIDFEDVMIRATSTVVSALHESGDGPEMSVYLELAGGNLRFDGASTMPLSAIHKARYEGSRIDHRHSANSLSIKFLDPGGVTPIIMPPLVGFEMRLLITVASAGDTSVTLFFNEGRVTVEFVTSILRSLKQLIELPTLLLL